MKKNFVLVLSLAIVLSMCTFAFAAESDSLSLQAPTGIYVDKNGDILVTDTFANNIVKMNGDKLNLVAGRTLLKDLYGFPADQYLDGKADVALFAEPYAIVPFLDGYAVSDGTNNIIRYIVAGEVKTLAGTEKAGLKNGFGQSVAFNRPTGLAVDDEGNLYIADTLNGAIRKMSTKGEVTTYVAGLSEPTGLCFANGVLYVADTGNQRICTIKDGKITHLAGDMDYRYDDKDYKDAIAGGYVDGALAKARFAEPMSIAVDTQKDIIYVGDAGNNAIRKIENGKVSTVVKQDSLALQSFPADPLGLVYNGGQLYVADAMAGVLVLDGSVLDGKIANFSDVKANAWYKNAVDYVYSNGFFSGTSATMFSPQTPMTRGMFVTVIGRVHEGTYQSVIIAGEAVFKDIAENMYYAKSASFAADNGIASGVGDGYFAPEKNITREQMALMLYNYMKFVGEDMSLTPSQEKMYLEMSDSEKVSSWAIDAVKWAVATGIINGKDGKLAPQDTATRAEVAQILLNISTK